MHSPRAASARRVQTVRGVTDRQRNGASSVDPQNFDRMIGQLARALSRRSLVGGSLGAAVLSAVGLGDESLARKKGRDDRTATAQACIPTGKKCPARKPRGKKGETLNCEQCCQGFSITSKNKKGQKIRTCACKPVGKPADRPSQCCTGLSNGSSCISAATRTLPEPSQPEPSCAETCTGCCD